VTMSSAAAFLPISFPLASARDPRRDDPQFSVSNGEDHGDHETADRTDRDKSSLA